MIRLHSATHSTSLRSTPGKIGNGIPQSVIVILMVMSFFCSAAGAGFGKGTNNKKIRKEAIAGCFFDDLYAAHGFNYAYPPTSEVSVSRDTVKVGHLALQFDLDPTEFSGGSVCLKDKTFNLKPYLNKGALQFWIKGAAGDEKAWVALVDEEESDTTKTVVRVDISWFGKISTDWSFISIPLEHFGERGVYWDEKDKREIDNDFDWDKVAEFRIEVRKGENTTFRVWVDDIVVTKSIR